MWTIVVSVKGIWTDQALLYTYYNGHNWSKLLYARPLHFPIFDFGLIFIAQFTYIQPLVPVLHMTFNIILSRLWILRPYPLSYVSLSFNFNLILHNTHLPF